ncbi:hypothetical protein Taro_029379, partial [Colocasia esculenta]|nr:hypothetical protein [Colocasia esculenta]
INKKNLPSPPSSSLASASSSDDGRRGRENPSLRSKAGRGGSSRGIGFVTGVSFSSLNLSVGRVLWWGSAWRGVERRAMDGQFVPPNLLQFLSQQLLAGVICQGPRSNMEASPAHSDATTTSTITTVDASAVDSLLDFGKMEYGCKHYRRRCKIRAPCCNQVFTCRHCHNESVVFHFSLNVFSLAKEVCIFFPFVVCLEIAVVTPVSFLIWLGPGGGGGGVAHKRLTSMRSGAMTSRGPHKCAPTAGSTWGSIFVISASSMMMILRKSNITVMNVAYAGQLNLGLFLVSYSSSLVTIVGVYPNSNGCILKTELVGVRIFSTVRNVALVIQSIYVTNTHA